MSVSIRGFATLDITHVDPASVEISLLGGFDLRCDDWSVGVPTSAQRLIALLALRDRSLPRTQVGGILWPESSEEHAAGSVRSALWRLQRLRPGVVEKSRQYLRLSPWASVDVRRLARLASAFATGGVIHSEDAQWVVEAGELLPAWDEEWLVPERERLRQLRVDMLEWLAQELVRRGRFGLAAEVGLAAVEAEPLRESTNRSLIEAYLAQRNLADAFRQYRAYAILLHAELRLAPSIELRELVERHMPAARGARRRRRRGWRAVQVTGPSWAG